MTATKNAPRPAPSPARAAAPQPAAFSPGPAPGSAATAVLAALKASPGGATAAAIATRAGVDRPAAREGLAAMEQAGTATRTRGGKRGVPDTWSMAADQAGATRDPHIISQQADTPNGPDRGSNGTGGSSADHSTAPAGAPRPGSEGATTAAEPGGDAGLPSAPRQVTRPNAAGTATGAGKERAAPASPGNDAGPPAPASAAQPAADDAPPSPELIEQVTGHIDQIRAAITAAAAALAGGGQPGLRAAQAAMDEIRDQAAQGRRALRAAAGGSRAAAARPGGLRDKVLAHLQAHPGAELTPHEIHKVLGNSSGAIANALDTLVQRGSAELASDKPRRFRLAAA
jgi:hypothetical protein